MTIGLEREVLNQRKHPPMLSMAPTTPTERTEKATMKNILEVVSRLMSGKKLFGRPVGVDAKEWEEECVARRKMMSKKNGLLVKPGAGYLSFIAMV